jgi:hypothetical protein
LIWSTRFWRYLRAARVLSLRLWMLEGGVFFEGGDSKDEESGGFGDREFGWLLVSWFEMRSCWRLEAIFKLGKF